MEFWENFERINERRIGCLEREEEEEEEEKRALPILGCRRTATSIAFITPYLSCLPATRGNHLLLFLQHVPLRAKIFVPLPRCASMPLPCMHIGYSDNFDEAYTVLVLIFRKYVSRLYRTQPITTGRGLIQLWSERDCTYVEFTGNKDSFPFLPKVIRFHRSFEEILFLFERWLIWEIK